MSISAKSFSVLGPHEDGASLLGHNAALASEWIHCVVRPLLVSCQSYLIAASCGRNKLSCITLCDGDSLTMRSLPLSISIFTLGE